MNNKWLIGIKLFSASLLLVAIFQLYKLIVIFNIFVKKFEAQNLGAKFYLFALNFGGTFNLIVTVFSSFAFIFVFFGLIKLKKWSVQLLIPLASFIAISKVLYLLLMFRMAALVYIISRPPLIIIYMASIVFYFTRPKVKEQFK